jgi:hypothetical protein
MSNIIFKSQITVPIYNAPVLLVVAKDAAKARACYNKRFGKEDVGPFKALAVHQDHDYGIFFQQDHLTHEMIGHEIKHVAGFVLVITGVIPPKSKKKRLTKAQLKKLAKIESDRDEAEAYLTGYLHMRIYKLFKKHNLKFAA